MGTYNAGLAPIDVPYATERAPEVIDALSATPLDLLCVQEFWLEMDWSAMSTATEEQWPHTQRLPADPVDALCTPAEFEPLQVCVDESCPDLSGEALSDCALDSCLTEIGALSAGCAGCLITEVEGGADVESLRAACLGGSGGADVETFIYDGAYDTGILTSAPVLAQESFVLDSYLYRASIDYMLVDTPLGELHAFCTHLASDVAEFEYRGDFDSWEGEQAHQIEQLIDFIDQKTADSDLVVVLGDLNTGPAIEAHDIAPEWPSHYDRLIESGLTDPYADSDDVACTYCPDNTFNDPESDGTLIDHILIRGFDGRISTERFMTGVVTITVEGQDVTTNLSDHYGLIMTLGGEAP